jgi:small subunit ribosomal protein S15e
MADDAAATASKKRPFRKHTYRGVELDQLLDMSTDELVELFPARARRRFQRGLKRKPQALIKKLRKAKKEAAAGGDFQEASLLQWETRKTRFWRHTVLG